jgi:hypothetical protein
VIVVRDDVQRSLVEPDGGAASVTGSTSDQHRGSPQLTTNTRSRRSAAGETMAPAAEPRVRRVPLGELILRQQAVIDCAVELVDQEADYRHLSTSTLAAGYEVAAARERFENARRALRVTVAEFRA